MDLLIKALDLSNLEPVCMQTIQGLTEKIDQQRIEGLFTTDPEGKREYTISILKWAADLLIAAQVPHYLQKHERNLQILKKLSGKNITPETAIALHVFSERMVMLEFEDEQIKGWIQQAISLYSKSVKDSANISWVGHIS